MRLRDERMMRCGEMRCERERENERDERKMI
jgi:hypothetical protein